MRTGYSKSEKMNPWVSKSEGKGTKSEPRDTKSEPKGTQREPKGTPTRFIYPSAQAQREHAAKN